MSNIIDSIQLSGVTYTLQGSGGGGGTVDSAITSASTDAVESKAIYNATHVEQVDLWTPTDSSSYRDTSQSLYKVYVQYTGDTALDEQVQVEIYYGSSSTRETLSGNVYQETATTSSVFTSTFDNGKWIIESLSPNYIVNIYSDYRFRIWTYDRTVGGDFAADVIKDDIIPYIGDVDDKVQNSVFGGSFGSTDNDRQVLMHFNRNNGKSFNTYMELNDLKYTSGVLSTDIQIPTGEVGWTEITPQNNCTAGNMPTNKVKVTYSGQTVSASSRGLRFDAVLIYSNGNRYYTTKIYWSDTTTPTVDGCSAVTATYDSTDDSVIIELPTGETTYDGLTGTFSISNFRSNSCQFGTGISSVKYYGDITEDIYTSMAHKQDTLSAGTGISISGNVISATGGGGGSPTVELTQAEYDALVSAGTVSADTYYIISDATAFDPTTKVDTSAFTAYSAATNTALNNKVDTSAITSSVTSASTDSEIPTAKAVWEAASGGGTTYTAGRGIDITNDTISVSLPISAGTGSDSIQEGYGTKASGDSSHAEGTNTIASGESSHAEGYASTASGSSSHAEGLGTKAYGDFSHAEGLGTIASGSSSHAEGANTKASGGRSHAEGANTKAYGDSSHAEGELTTASGDSSHAEGSYTVTSNDSEHASGKYNVSSKASTTFGDSGNTLFSVGNGTSSSARHNAFEIRQNGDIYLSSGGTDIKLQDHLGGGGSSINVVQTTGSSTTDVMSQDAVTTQLSGYVTTNTEQTISGRKIFTYSSNSAKAIEFKQTSDSAKVGFRVTNSASTNNELAAFEFRPNTYTDSSSVSHPLLYLGHYRNNSVATAGVPQTMIGFRQYDQSGAAAYHYFMPLPAEAKTPFSLTTSFKNYFAPLGFKNGDTMITTDNTGVADFSSVLGGLKLVKITQSAYDALTTKDDNTVYFIGDSTNGYTMKIGSANVN